MRKAFLFFAVISLFSCARKWTDKDKSEFMSGCLSHAVKGMDETKAKHYCGCLLNKMVEKYPNANDAKYVRYDTSIIRLAKYCSEQQ